MIRRLEISAIYSVIFCLLAPAIAPASAQSAQEPTRPSLEGKDERQAARERQNLYESYFREVCQTKQLCDATCKQVYQSLENKSLFVWKCP
jgi:hypothetical protein